MYIYRVYYLRVQLNKRKAQIGRSLEVLKFTRSSGVLTLISIEFA